MEYEVSVPELFTELKSKSMFKHAVIGGGYLRDQVYKVAPKDIDVFVPVTSGAKFEADFNSTFIELSKAGWVFVNRKLPPRVVKGDDGYTTNTDVKTVYCLEKNGQAVDVIAVRLNLDGFIANLMETFPWANSQIVHDGKKLITSEGFDYDIKHGVMTLRHISRIADLPRLMKKFQEVSDKIGLQFSSDYILTRRKGDDWL